MDTSLIQARMIRVGDFIEHPNLQVFRPIKSIDNQFGRLYFKFGDSTPRTALEDDFVVAYLMPSRRVNEIDS